MTKALLMRDLIPPEPVKVVRRSATSIEQIRADVAARFAKHHFDIAPDSERARKRIHTSMNLGGLRIEHFDLVGGWISGPKPRAFELLFLVRGGLRVVRDGVETCATPGGSVISVGGAECQLRVDSMPGSSVFCLTLSPELLQTAGTSVLGDDFKLDEARLMDTTRVTGVALTRNVKAVYLEMLELEKAGLGSLAVPMYNELLANLSLAALYPERLATHHDCDAPAPCKLVEKAEDLIRARLAEPITIQEIAAELGVTARTLQLGFRRHRSYTPLQFLLTCRLGRARERLLDPDLRSNVQSVAMSCGFVSMSKFAIRYRAAYGETPSVTLERGRRR